MTPSFHDTKRVDLFSDIVDVPRLESPWPDNACSVASLLTVGIPEFSKELPHVVDCIVPPCYPALLLSKQVIQLQDFCISPVN